MLYTVRAVWLSYDFFNTSQKLQSVKYSLICLDNGFHQVYLNYLILTKSPENSYSANKVSFDPSNITNETLDCVLVL